MNKLVILIRSQNLDDKLLLLCSVVLLYFIEPICDIAQYINTT